MTSEYIKVTVNEYEGEVSAADGRIGSIQTSKGGSMPDATELRRYAEFIIALAQASECLIGNLESEVAK